MEVKNARRTAREREAWIENQMQHAEDRRAFRRNLWIALSTSGVSLAMNYLPVAIRWAIRVIGAMQ